MADNKNNLIQGTLELMILETLTAGAMHGYGIVQRIHEKGDELLKIEDGSLYPALYRMEERGWITAEWGRSENNRKAKFYSLTKAGAGQLEIERNNWARVSAAVGKILSRA